MTTTAADLTTTLDTLSTLPGLLGYGWIAALAVVALCLVAKVYITRSLDR